MILRILLCSFNKLLLFEKFLRKTTFFLPFPSHYKYYETRAIERIESTKTYATKQTAINDKELTDFYCASYKTYISCGGFIHQNANKYICIGKCDDGNELFVRFKFTKLHNDRFSVSVNLYEMNEENKNYYLSKKLKKQKADEAKADYLNTRHIAG